MTLICRQHWSQSLGVAGRHMRCVGRAKSQVVTIGSWSELGMEGKAGRGSSWCRVDVGGPGLIGRVQARPREGVGFGQGRPSMLAHARQERLRDGSFHFHVISFDCQSLGSWFQGLGFWFTEKN